jgi:hypothetical protein
MTHQIHWVRNLLAKTTMPQPTTDKRQPDCRNFGLAIYWDSSHGGGPIVQIALRTMSVTRQREQRIWSHDSTEIGIGCVSDIGACSEKLANMTGIAEDNHVPEDRQMDREGRPVATSQDLQRDSMVGHCHHALDGPRETRARRQLHDSRRRPVISHGHRTSQLDVFVKGARR